MSFSGSGTAGLGHSTRLTHLMFSVFSSWVACTNPLSQKQPIPQFLGHILLGGSSQETGQAEPQLSKVEFSGQLNSGSA